MALDVGTLVAYLQLNAEDYGRGLRESEGKLKRFAGTAAKIAVGIGSAFAAVGAINFTRDIITQASDLNESASKIGQVFGNQASAIEDFAARADKALGLSKQAALDSAATFATFGKGAGLAGQALTDFSEQSVTLAGDLASFFNTSPADAAEAIGAAFRGESEPIRAYGVLLDEASVKAEAVRKGIVKARVDVIALGKAQFAANDAQRAYNKAVAEHGRSSEEAAKAGNNLQAAQAKLQSIVQGTIPDLTQQQRVLATQAAIIEQTSDAQGDFARTSGGLANQQRILAAEFANAKTELGQALLPYAKDFVSTLKDMISFGRQNQAWLVPLLGVLAAVVVAMYAISGAVKVWTAAQWLLNIAMDANPIGLVILAIAAIVAGIYLLWTNSAAFRDFFIGLWGGIKDAAVAVGEWFAGPFADFFVTGWNNAKQSFSAALDWIEGKVIWLIGIPSRVGNALYDGSRKLGEALYSGVKWAINMIIRAWNALDFGIHIHFPGWLPPPLGGKGFDVNDVIPDIPYLARGGVVMPRQGGTLVTMAEAGQVEIASPEPMLRRLIREEAGAGGARRLEVWIHGDGLLRNVRTTTRVQGGDPGVTLVGAAS